LAFNSAKTVLQMDDKESGVVIGKGVISYDAGNFMTGLLNYTLTIPLE